MKEYKLQFWVRSFMFGSVIVCVVGAIILTYFASISQSKDAFPIAYIVITAILIFALLIAFLGSRWKLVVTENSIVFGGIVRDKQLLFSQILGFRLIDKYIIVEANDSSLPRLKIDDTIIGKEEFVRWLSENFRNLDEEDIKKEIREIAQNENFGANESKRIEKLNRAKDICILLDVIAVILTLWAFIKPYPYIISCSSSALFPIIVIIIYRLNNGIYKLSAEKKSAYPNMSLAVWLPCCALCVRALDYKLVDYDPIWIGTISISFAAAFIISIGAKRAFKTEPRKKLLLSGVVFVGLIYGFGVSVFANCYFDENEMTYYETKVLSKRIDHGKITYYDLELDPWGPIKTANKVTVNRKLYDRIEKGDVIKIQLRPGKIGARWFTISQ